MRFKDYSDRTDAINAVVESECDVGVVREGTDTMLIYRLETYERVMKYVAETLGQLFTFNSFQVNGIDFMRTKVRMIESHTTVSA